WRRSTPTSPAGRSPRRLRRARANGRRRRKTEGGPDWAALARRAGDPALERVILSQSAGSLLALLVPLLLVLLHDGSRRDFLGALAVAAGFFGALLDVLVLALLLLANASQMLLLGHRRLRLGRDCRAPLDGAGAD